MKGFLDGETIRGVPTRELEEWQVQMFVRVWEQDVMAEVGVIKGRQKDMTTMMFVLAQNARVLNEKEHHPRNQNIRRRHRHRLGQTHTRTHLTRQAYQPPTTNMADQV